MSTERPFGKRGKWLAVLALVAFVGGWFVFNALAADGDKKKGGDKATPPASVRVAVVEETTVAPQLTSVGNVIAHESVALIPRLNSQVVAVRFKAGDAVTKGDVLFELDARELQANLGEARAKLAGDQAQLANLKKEYDRQELGVTKGFASQAERDNAKAAYENQQALVKSDQAQIESLRVQLGYTLITAPISGRTGTINFTLGNIVRANDTAPLVTINQIQPISVEAALPQNSIDAVRAAQAQGPVAATAVTSTGKIVHGQLDYIDNAINTTNGTFAARAVFANTDETLWPGTLVNLNIALGQGERQLAVPEIAVQSSQTGSFVYVIDAGNIAKHRDIKIIRIQNGQALVGEGLRKGERVAVDGIMAIKEDAKVEVAQGNGGPAPSGEVTQPAGAPGASGLEPATSAPQDTGGAPNNTAPADGAAMPAVGAGANDGSSEAAAGGSGNSSESGSSK